MNPKPVTLRQLRHHWEIYLFIIPTVLLIGLFQYYPASSGIFHSFFRWNGADISEPVGLRNYKDLLSNTEFWNSFKLAFILGGWNVIKMIPALLVAVAIHRCRSSRMQFLYRTLFVVPMVIPGLVVVLIWRSFFFEATAGYLNQFLLKTGLFNLLVHLDQAFDWGGIFQPGKMPAWLGDPRLIVTACIVWGFPWVGSFAVLTHLAKLQGISKDVYEAADIDGVGWWSKFTKIELPLIMGSIYLLLVFVIIDTVKDAGMILALAGIYGGPGGKATVPALFMIRKAFLDQQMGYACAVGIILTIVVMVLQKVSTLIMDPEGMNARQRLTFRGTMLAAAIGFLVWRFGYGGVANFTTVAIVLLLFALPYETIRRLLRRPKATPLVAPPPEATKGWEDRRTERAFRRQTDPFYRALSKTGEYGLRFVKHAWVWTVLAFAFLPLYLMVIVSVKNNEQFYLAPATLTFPTFWENWRTAWDMVTPTVANSLFISTSSTMITLGLALCGAYFFARLRAPGH
ncbi:MAG: ABC transporter permease subunit, partial [Kiritimatiellae bacterium]|nr:ABC transporter permease subunit [Kiritimatiellia bacterium]